MTPYRQPQTWSGEMIDHKGIIVPLVTPLHEDESVDYQGLRRLVDHVVAGGAHGIFVAGTTGEYAKLDAVTRHALFAGAIECAAGRVPVYAGVTDAGYLSVKQHVRAAEQAGAAALVIGLPYYFTIETADEALAWFSAVLELTSLPVLLYDIPGNVGASIAPSVVQKLAPHIAGLKDSSGSGSLMREYLAALGGPGRRAVYLSGCEALLLEAADQGADGYVPSLANVFPQLWARAWAVRHDRKTLAVLADGIAAGIALNTQFAGSIGHIAWKKRVLALLDICGSAMTRPARPLAADADPQLRQIMQRVQELLADQGCGRCGGAEGEHVDDPA